MYVVTQAAQRQQSLLVQNVIATIAHCLSEAAKLTGKVQQDALLQLLYLFISAHPLLFLLVVPYKETAEHWLCLMLCTSSWSYANLKHVHKLCLGT